VVQKNYYWDNRFFCCEPFCTVSTAMKNLFYYNHNKTNKKNISFTSLSPTTELWTHLDMNCIKSGHKFSTKSCLAIELAWNVLIITLTHIWTQPRGYESICDVPGENKYTDYQDFPVISRDYYWELLFVKQGFHYNASQANQLLYKGILVHLVHNGKSSFASCLLEINQLLWGSGWNNVFSIDRLFKLILVRACSALKYSWGSGGAVSPQWVQGKTRSLRKIFQTLPTKYE